MVVGPIDNNGKVKISNTSVDSIQVAAIVVSSVAFAVLSTGIAALSGIGTAFVAVYLGSQAPLYLTIGGANGLLIGLIVSLTRVKNNSKNEVKDPAPENSSPVEGDSAAAEVAAPAEEEVTVEAATAPEEEAPTEAASAPAEEEVTVEAAAAAEEEAASAEVAEPAEAAAPAVEEAPAAAADVQDNDGSDSAESVDGSRTSKGKLKERANKARLKALARARAFFNKGKSAK